jgi:hypothetical protein
LLHIDEVLCKYWKILIELSEGPLNSRLNKWFAKLKIHCVLKNWKISNLNKNTNKFFMRVQWRIPQNKQIYFHHVHPRLHITALQWSRWLEAMITCSETLSDWVLSLFSKSRKKKHIIIDNFRKHKKIQDCVSALLKVTSMTYSNVQAHPFNYPIRNIFILNMSSTI